MGEYEEGFELEFETSREAYEFYTTAKECVAEGCVMVIPGENTRMVRVRRAA